MKFFKSKSQGPKPPRKQPPLPAALVEILESAPPGARYLVADVLYSAGKGRSGLLFRHWADQDFRIMRVPFKRPPFHIELPESVGLYYFEFIRNSSAMDLEKWGWLPDDAKPPYQVTEEVAPEVKVEAAVQEVTLPQGSEPQEEEEVGHEEAFTETQLLLTPPEVP